METILILLAGLLLLKQMLKIQPALRPKRVRARNQTMH